VGRGSLGLGTYRLREAITSVSLFLARTLSRTPGRLQKPLPDMAGHYHSCPLSAWEPQPEHSSDT
jgi:hypothetical protein